jgi:hypothetical protein
MANLKQTHCLLVHSYSRVIMDLTNIETQSVIHFHCLRGSFIQIYTIFIKKNIVGFSFFFF